MPMPCIIPGGPGGIMSGPPMPGPCIMWSGPWPMTGPPAAKAGATGQQQSKFLCWHVVASNMGLATKKKIATLACRQAAAAPAVGNCC